MLQGENCHSTFSARVVLREESKPPLKVGRQFGKPLRESLGEDNCDSKVAARSQCLWRDI